MRAAAGASRRTLQPRKANQIEKPEAKENAEEPHRSDTFQQAGEIERRRPTQAAAVALQERFGGLAPLFAHMHKNSHSALSFEEYPSDSITSLAMR